MDGLTWGDLFSIIVIGGPGEDRLKKVPYSVSRNVQRVSNAVSSSRADPIRDRDQQEADPAHRAVPIRGQGHDISFVEGRNQDGDSKTCRHTKPQIRTVNFIAKLSVPLQLN